MLTTYLRHYVKLRFIFGNAVPARRDGVGKRRLYVSEVAILRRNKWTYVAYGAATVQVPALFGCQSSETSVTSSVTGNT